MQVRSKARCVIAYNEFAEKREFDSIPILYKNEEEMCHILKCA
jgi:hypothetical protein